jgi:hypothetical protein
MEVSTFSGVIKRVVFNLLQALQEYSRSNQLSDSGADSDADNVR